MFNKIAVALVAALALSSPTTATAETAQTCYADLTENGDGWTYVCNDGFEAASIMIALSNQGFRCLWGDTWDWGGTWIFTCLRLDG